MARDAHAALVKELRERLDDFQLVVVDLYHSPGAGGSTLARRVAWDMHRGHPTAVLRSYTPTTAERIDEIYQQTGLWVLVIAESADLPESDRNEWSASCMNATAGPSCYGSIERIPACG